MELLVSGEAGYGVVWRGNKLVLTAPHISSSAIELPVSSFRFLFSGLSDTRAFTVSRESEIRAAIQSEKDKNRALMLMLMLLDQEEPEDIKELIPPVLEKLITDNEIKTHLSNTMFSRPLPDGAALPTAATLAGENRNLADFLETLAAVQPTVHSLIEKIHQLPEDLLSYATHGRDIEALMADSGAIAEAALAIATDSKGASIDSAKIKAFSAAQRSNIRDVRTIILAWFKALGISENKRPKKELRNLISAEAIENQHRRRSMVQTRTISDHEAYQRATSQIDEIKNVLRKLDFAKARKYMIELKKAQIDNEDQEFAAKSLCNISSFASDIFQYSFALEAANEAVGVAPEDGRSWSQLADCLIHLSRYDDAEDALRKAEIWGQAHFVASSRARILRLKGKTEAAIEAYKVVIKDFPQAEELFNSLCGLGEAYREIQKFDEGLATFEEATKKFQYQSMCWCGKAQTLAIIGRLKEARSAYERSLQIAEPSVQVLTGLGRVHNEMGELETSIDILKRAIASFPLEPAGYRELGRTYRLRGDFESAIGIYQEMKKHFPFDYGGFRGVAEALVEAGNFERAEKEFIEAVDRFPKEAVLRTRKAQLYKKWGKFERALQEFSQAVHDFPLSAYAKFGQADLFKELREYDKALLFYEQISEENAYLDSKVCRAAIYVSLGDFPSALSLLPSTDPRTRNDWVAVHIRGMVLLKSGKTKEAEELFRNSWNNVPFASQRPYFASALAIVRLRQQEYAAALDMLEGRKDYASNILYLHSYAGLKRMGEAEKVYTTLKDNCPHDVIPLREELAAHAGIGKSGIRNDADWIFRQECNMVSLAITQQQAA